MWSELQVFATTENRRKIPRVTYLRPKRQILSGNSLMYTS